MTKNEKLMIGVLILITIAIICILAFSKSETWKKTLNTNVQKSEKGQNIIDDKNEDYSVEKVTDSGYFVIAHNKIYNKERLDKFIENTSIDSENRIEDSIKIIQYTIEGDPIITELIYKKTENTSTYILKNDNTRDKWSAEADRKIRINEDIPGNIYGITERKEGNIVIVELALHAEIDYADENAKRYETIHVCSYTSNSKQEQISTFNGKVIEANQNSIIVEPNEGEEIRKTADKISVGLGKNNDEKYEVGSIVKIIYTGSIMETYPAQIEAVSIEVNSK